ncbi:MAG: hypothetical protein ABIG95_05085 [Candidatus Woesearchaeota archaeon]
MEKKLHLNSFSVDFEQPSGTAIIFKGEVSSIRNVSEPLGVTINLISTIPGVESVRSLVTVPVA